MTISRNNYETIFLLYVDGELSPDKRREVEDFCLANPDLAEELQGLQAAKLDNDHPYPFPGKQQLLQPEPWDESRLENWQQNMLNLLDEEGSNPEWPGEFEQKEWSLLLKTRLQDSGLQALPGKNRLIKPILWNENELTPQQIQLLEAAETGDPLTPDLLQDPEFERDYLILQQARLLPEHLPMPNKHRLLKQEEREKTPVLPLLFKRLAAAAIIVGLGWVVFDRLSNTTLPQQPEVAQAQASDQATQPGNSTPGIDNNPTSRIAAAGIGENQPTPSGIVLKDEKNAAKPRPKVMPENTLLAANAKPRPDVSEEEDWKTYRLSAMEESALKEAMNVRITSEAPEGREITGMAVNNLTAQVDNPKEDLFRYALESEEEDSYINIAGAKVKKQKLRGVVRQLTRRVGRSFDKSTVAPASYAAATE